MSAANAQIVQAWLQTNKGPQEYLRLIKQIGSASKQSSGQAASGFMGMTRTALRFATSVFGIGSAFQAATTAMRVVRAEIEQIRRVRATAADASVESGRQLAIIRQFLAPGSDVTADEIAARARQVSSASSLATTLAVAGEAISAGTRAETTGERVDIGLKTVEILGDKFKDDLDTLGEFAASAVRLNLSFPGKKPEELLGQMVQALSAGPSGPQNAKEFAEHIVPLLARMSQQGFTLEDAIAEVIGVQTRAFDRQGASTRTTFDKFFTLMDQRLPAEFRRQGRQMLDFLVESDDPRAVELNRQILRGASAELRAMASDQGLTIEQLAERMNIEGALKGDVQGRARTLFAMIERLQRKGFAEGPEQTKALVNATRENILSGEQAAQDLARRQSEGLRSAEEAAFHARNAADSVLTLARTRPEVGMRGVVSQMVADTLPVLGGSALRTNINKIITELDATGASVPRSARVAAAALQRQVNVIEAPQMNVVGRQLVPRGPLSEQEEADRKLLVDLITQLRRLADAQEKGPVQPPVDPPASSPAAAAGGAP